MASEIRLLQNTCRRPVQYPSGELFAAIGRWLEATKELMKGSNDAIDEQEAASKEKKELTLLTMRVVEARIETERAARVVGRVLYPRRREMATGASASNARS